MWSEGKAGADETRKELHHAESEKAPLDAPHCQLRRSHDFLTAVGLSECPNCHEKKLPHRACPKCGSVQGSRGSGRQGSRQVALSRQCPCSSTSRLTPSVPTKLPSPRFGAQSSPAANLPVRVHLVGPEAELRDLLDEHLENEDLPIVIHHASERIGMEEKAAHAVRTKRDSSMRVGLKLVREGKAAGFVTAGNTGAAMATAKMVLGALPGVDRPALATPMPTSTGNPCVLLDVGANVDCKAHNLEQFAVMGEMYARSVLKIDAAARGPALDRRRRDQGQRPDARGISAAEGAADQVHRQRGRPRHFQRPGGRDCLRRLCGQRGAEDQRRRGPLCARRAARVADADGYRARWARCCLGRPSTIFAAGWTTREYGGAQLLGVRGVCIIGHGSSNDRAIFNGIRVAYEFAQGRHQRAHRAGIYAQAEPASGRSR